MPTSLEVCAGAGGTAIGLERAGFRPLALVENDRHACATLRLNRPRWRVIEDDLRTVSGYEFAGVDLLSGGVPCPPFSVAGKQLGSKDERDLFPEMVRLTAECSPKAVMIENVRGLLDPAFAEYREKLEVQFQELGYASTWAMLNASDFGVPQLRPRVVLVAMSPERIENFSWPTRRRKPPTVGEALRDQMAASGWEGADAWADAADRIAPTLVGGSKKHGGPDLGPTRARKAWAALGVNGGRVAADPPEPGFVGMPLLTVPMAATVQGFPRTWQFSGPRTHAYRQVGNAFPPPVAAAVARRILAAIDPPKGSRRT